jgi:hypothetical protein
MRYLCHLDSFRSMPSEAALLQLAEDRVLAKERYQDRKVDPLTRERQVQYRYIGLICERAVATVLGLTMNLDVSPRGDHRTNLTNVNGVPIDVIGRTLPRNGMVPDLLINTREKPRPDLACVLAIYRSSDHDPDLWGWAWERDVRENNCIVSYTSDTSFAYPRAMLKDIWSLEDAYPWRD